MFQPITAIDCWGVKIQKQDNFIFKKAFIQPDISSDCLVSVWPAKPEWDPQEGH